MTHIPVTVFNKYINGDTVDEELLNFEINDENLHSEILGTIVKRQPIGVAPMVSLSILISLTVKNEENVTHVVYWVLLIVFAGIFKLCIPMLSSSGKIVDNHNNSKHHLLILSAFLTGILWSIPIYFVSYENSVELATVVLIVSGIISGAVSSYLGNITYMLLVATLPCLSILLGISMNMDTHPYAIMASIVVFYIFILVSSRKTYKDARELFSAKLKNVELIKNLKNLAFEDSLTKLPNRRLLFELFEKYATDADRNNSKLAILFIDLDKFKFVNDDYGHEVGDYALAEVAMTMVANLRKVDIAARLGGDEFVAVLKDINNDEDAFLVVDKLKCALDKNITVNNVPVHISASIGVAIYPEQSRSLEELLKISDRSMYANKNEI